MVILIERYMFVSIGMIPSLSLRYDAFDVPKVYYLCSLGMIPPLSLRYDAFDVPKVCYLQYSLCMLPAIFFGYATFRVLSCATFLFPKV